MQVSEVLLMVKLHDFIILLSVAVRKQGVCPPLKISRSIFTRMSNYLLRRMFGLCHIMLAEYGGYLICQKDHQERTAIYTENGSTD